MTSTISDVSRAMRQTEGWDNCWWQSEETNRILKVGVANGWLTRPTTTQVFWTEVGCKLAEKRTEA